MDKRCMHCQSREICREDANAWFFIIVGFMSTAAIRVVTVLMSVKPLYGKIAWYIGVMGFIIFFVYKYKVFKMRAKMIEEHHLLEQLAKGEALSKRDNEIISQMLCKIKSNKERINFLFIFIASAIALAMAIYFDFITVFLST